VAVMPHCVVCDFGPADWLGEVQFTDYTIDWRPPTSWDGHPIIGWSNELGITAPGGVGLFCHEHFTRARRLRRLPAAEAVEQMKTGADLRRGPLGWLRDVFR
jgi:hypothetical protein